MLCPQRVAKKQRVGPPGPPALVHDSDSESTEIEVDEDETGASLEVLWEEVVFPNGVAHLEDASPPPPPPSPPPTFLYGDLDKCQRERTKGVRKCIKQWREPWFLATRQWKCVRYTNHVDFNRGLLEYAYYLAWKNGYMRWPYVLNLDQHRD